MTTVLVELFFACDFSTAILPYCIIVCRDAPPLTMLHYYCVP